MVEDLVELRKCLYGNTEQIDNTGWSKLEHWMRLLDSRYFKEVITPLAIRAITSVVVDSFCIVTEVLKVLEHNNCEIGDRPYNYSSSHSTFGSIYFLKSI